MEQANIRNFCIIAHIDHGKSTLADRLLEITNTVDIRHLKKQTLDMMELEQEKGITIKLKPVRMDYELDDTQYQLNLIDTPGHVDFAYEVSRSLAACEGAILVVDASQGIQAQTVSNVYKAIDADLTIIPVINKIDLPGAEISKCIADMEQTFGFKEDEILQVSAKTGIGIEKLLQEVIAKVPAPNGTESGALSALVFDTFYDDFLGVVAAVRVVDGKVAPEQLKAREKIKLMATGAYGTPEQAGVFKPERRETNKLKTGEVGYIATGLKDISNVRVGDTITWKNQEQSAIALPGYKEVKPFVFVSIFPIENDRFTDLREALGKLALSDSSLSYEPESSTALGFGFRCGFLGLLHADIIQERLEREYNLELISTTPTVEYEVLNTKKELLFIKSPSDLPDPSQIEEVKEPWIYLNIVSPVQYTGQIITLCEERRGIMVKQEYPTQDRIVLEYEMPLSELVFNFFDDLKSVSSGFASLDYDFLDYRAVKVVKLDVLVHNEVIPPLSQIVLKDKAQESGKLIVRKLKDVIPRQQFKVAIQAAIGGKIIAREDIAGFRKNVLAKMSGGHRDRKDKLLDIQKKGKARMKSIGKVSIPQDAFRQILRN